MRLRACSIRRLLGPLPFVFLAAFVALPLTVRAGDKGEEATSLLSVALGAIKTENISADLHFVADDEMRGRYTPSPELKIVARYLRSRLQRLGFRPAGNDGYFFAYDLAHHALDPARTVAGFKGPGGSETLVFGEEFFYSRGNLGKDGDAQGAVVFLGGASKEELEGAELEGRWALVLDDGERRGSRRALRSTGALGVIFLQTADYSGKPYAERFQGATERLVEGSLAYGEPRGSRRSIAPFSQLHLSAAAGAKLLAAAGIRQGTLPALRAELPLQFTETRRLLGGGNESVRVENVCGLWPGTDPVLSKEVLILSAHYDHIGMRGEEVCNGADDNGSGTCGLLALAEAFKAHGPFRRSVMLIWVSGEERGLWGSAAWVAEPVLPEGFRAVANLNIDMIGRNDPDALNITPTEDHEQHNFIVKLAEQLAPLEGFPELGDADKYYGRSDQANFALLDIPVAFLFSGTHEDYHKPSDTVEKIDCDKIRRVARLVLRLVDSLQGDTLGV